MCKVLKCVTLLVLVLAFSVFGAENITNTGLEYEQIQSKLEVLQYRFEELSLDLKEQREEATNNQRKIANELQAANRNFNHHERKITNILLDVQNAIEENVTSIAEQTRQILELQTICSNHDLIRNSLSKMYPNTKIGTEEITERVKSCSSQAVSGLCQMKIANHDQTVFMERHRFGGDWIVIMQRSDGSVDFGRNWLFYRTGFGIPGQEYWMGLENVRFLTEGFDSELLVEMEDYDGNYRYARYNAFALGAETDDYPLKEIGDYTGTAGDSLSSHKGFAFSTGDHGTRESCYGSYNSGWWFNNNCFSSLLTGIWSQNNEWTSITWQTFGSPSNKALKFVRMMIK